MKRSSFLALVAIAAMAVAPAVIASHSDNPADPAAALEGTYTFRLTPATSFSVLNPALSGLATAPRQDILRVGVLVFDDAGKVMGRVVATTDDNAGATLVKSFRITGTYTIDADGFGTLSISPVSPAAPGEDITDEGAETYAFKLNERARTLHLIQTDNDGGGAKIFLTGDAIQDRDLSKFGRDDDDDDEECDDDGKPNGKGNGNGHKKNKHKHKNKH